MQKWEYKIVFRVRGWQPKQKKTDAFRLSEDWRMYEDGEKVPESLTLEMKLKEFGNEGWELVAIVPNSSVLGGLEFNPHGAPMASDFAGYTTDERWVFKRPLE